MSGARGRDADRDEAARCWSLLGYDGGIAGVRRLAGGASGSAVYELTVDGREPLVLKVATDRTDRLRADRELRFYRDLGPTVPVRVPALLAGADGGDRTCLLFASAGVASDPARWSGDRWTRLAAELGRLHADRTATGWPGAKAGHTPTEDELRAAVGTWASMGYGALLAPLWPEYDRLAAALAELPSCLLHGDWHLGNILVDPSDRFVWIDWQDVGFGYGPEDLALLWQRAEFDGVPPPREAMLTTYAQARGVPDDAPLGRAAVAAELTLLLLAWPPYLAHAAAPGRGRLLDRLAYLVEAWRR